MGFFVINGLYNIATNFIEGDCSNTKENGGSDNKICFDDIITRSTTVSKKDNVDLIRI